MKRTYDVYKRTGGKIQSLTEAELENFEALDLESSGNEPEQTVMVSQSTIAKLLDIECDECDTGAVAQTLFDLASESGGTLTVDMITIGEEGADEQDEEYADEDLDEDEHDVFSRMTSHLTANKGDKEFKDVAPRKPSALSRDGKSEYGRFNAKQISTGTQFSRVLPDDEDYEEVEDEGQEDTPKRGRGRPAGASNKDKSYKPWTPEAKAAFKAKLAARRAGRAGASVNETEEDDRAIAALRAKFKAARAARSDSASVNESRVEAIRSKIRTRLGKNEELKESRTVSTGNSEVDLLASAITALYGE